jgi:uncharacterized protein YndB with AHSA1/START domain
MMEREHYRPGAATGAQVRKDGEKWTLVVTRDLRHPPAKVWSALTDPAQLREWAPFDADRDLGSVGAAKLSTVGTPKAHVTEARITRADAPRLLEYDWGGQAMRWQLESLPSGGTRLTLWHAIDKGFIAMGAAGWQICLDVLEHFMAGEPLGRIVGPEAMRFDWPRLNAEYSKQFGVEPASPPNVAKPS